MTSKSTLPPQQPRQPSRKTKSSWRKNVDISEIQAGLQEARDETIDGGLLVDRPAESLFALDVTGSTEIQKSYNKSHKPLKVDEILARRSAIPAVDSRKRPSAVTDGVLEPSRKKSRTDRVNGKEYRRLQEIAYGPQSLRDVVKVDDRPSHDPWDGDEQVDKTDPRFSYLEKAKPTRMPDTIRQAPISLVEGIKNVPSIAMPRPSASYNPVYEDWDALLTTAGQEEVELELKRREEARVEQERLERIAAAEREAEQEDGARTEDESAWEGFESDYEAAEWLKKKRPQRKTPQERKKAQRKKEREREDVQRQRAKEKLKQERQIAELGRQTKQKALTNASELEAPVLSGAESLRDVDDRVLRRRRLGKDAIPEPPLELVLPEELQDSLRLLKPEGNLLRDRFRNVLVSGKLESRKPIQQAKKKRRTLTEKWTHKDFEIGV